MCVWVVSPSCVRAGKGGGGGEKLPHLGLTERLTERLG